uniref:Uncharacterized protein n=1 Tax=Arundo donax TaxID=35708 RepID=A0A0A9SW02_ARUDO
MPTSWRYYQINDTSGHRPSSSSSITTRSSWTTQTLVSSPAETLTATRHLSINGPPQRRSPWSTRQRCGMGHSTPPRREVTYGAASKPSMLL